MYFFIWLDCQLDNMENSLLAVFIIVTHECHVIFGAWRDFLGCVKRCLLIRYLAVMHVQAEYNSVSLLVGDGEGRPNAGQSTVANARQTKQKSHGRGDC
jgi:hypothetical protein